MKNKGNSKKSFIKIIVVLCVIIGILIFALKIFENNQSFSMPIEDVFNTDNKGVIVVGHIENGVINVNDKIKIIDEDKNIIVETNVTSIEVLGSYLDTAKEGQYVGLGLGELEIYHYDIKEGQVVVASE